MKLPQAVPPLYWTPSALFSTLQHSSALARTVMQLLSKSKSVDVRVIFTAYGFSSLKPHDDFFFWHCEGLAEAEVTSLHYLKPPHARGKIWWHLPQGSPRDVKTWRSWSDRTKSPSTQAVVLSCSCEAALRANPLAPALRYAASNKELTSSHIFHLMPSRHEDFPALFPSGHGFLLFSTFQTTELNPQLQSGCNSYPLNVVAICPCPIGIGADKASSSGPMFSGLGRSAAKPQWPTMLQLDQSKQRGTFFRLHSHNDAKQGRTWSDFKLTAQIDRHWVQTSYLTIIQQISNFCLPKVMG